MEIRDLRQKATKLVADSSFDGDNIDNWQPGPAEALADLFQEVAEKMSFEVQQLLAQAKALRRMNEAIVAAKDAINDKG